MITIDKMAEEAAIKGYLHENTEAKVCQDLILKALSESPLGRNVTIKGGVVMRSISGNARRATLDMDIDFIRYSLSDEAIADFIKKLNCLPGIYIEQIGIPEELKQQDYRGKRVYVKITDNTGDFIESKIDFGVHKNLSVEQEEYCFDIACFEEGANLLVNSKEQMLTEKLRSLLKFGPNSTRFKDIFDICYLSDLVNKPRLLRCFDTFIFSDSGMRENCAADILKRVSNTFSNQRYLSRLKTSRKNWLDMPIDSVLNKILKFLTSLSQ